MNPTFLLFLQSMLIAGQTINAGIATMTHNPAVTLSVGAVVGALQFFVQHVGNQTQPSTK